MGDETRRWLLEVENGVNTYRSYRSSFRPKLCTEHSLELLSNVPKHPQSRTESFDPSKRSRVQINELTSSSFLPLRAHQLHPSPQAAPSSPFPTAVETFDAYALTTVTS